MKDSRLMFTEGELPPEDAPLPLLQAYLESRIEKHIPPLMTRL